MADQPRMVRSDRPSHMSTFDPMRGMMPPARSSLADLVKIADPNATAQAEASKPAAVAWSLIFAPSPAKAGYLRAYFVGGKVPSKDALGSWRWEQHDAARKAGARQTYTGPAVSAGPIDMDARQRGLRVFYAETEEAALAIVQREADAGGAADVLASLTGAQLVALKDGRLTRKGAEAELGRRAAQAMRDAAAKADRDAGTMTEAERAFAALLTDEARGAFEDADPRERAEMMAQPALFEASDYRANVIPSPVAVGRAALTPPQGG